MLMVLMTALLAKTGQSSPPLERGDLLLTFGRANAFKEGDVAIGVAAKDEAERKAARERLAGLKLGDLDSRRFIDDEVSRMIMESLDPDARQKVAGWTVGELKRFFLEKNEAEIKALRDGLSSEAIAAAAKLMTDDELIAAAAKIYNPNAGSTFGAKGLLREPRAAEFADGRSGRGAVQLPRRVQLRVWRRGARDQPGGLGTGAT